MFTPTIYGENHVAAGRYLNILFLFHLPVLLAITTYMIVLGGKFLSIHVNGNATILTLSILFIGIFGGCFTNNYEDFSTLTVLLDLRNGSAEKYKAETEERTALMLSDLPRVSIHPRTVYPRLFVKEDISADWVNEIMSEYYGKEIIVDE